MSARFELPDLGVLEAAGVDAGQFLQGQLSNDVLRLAVGGAQLTALHSAQGRVEALLWLVRAGPDAFLAVLPRELLAAVLATLRKRVFRARVSLAEVSDRWSVAGALAAPANTLHAVVDTTGRCIVFRPIQSSESAAQEPAPPGSREQWRTLDIAAGLPQVYASSSGSFVAQMLNLDLLGGISFDKGCYIGQEIVARAHYRGRVKRRLQRFRAALATTPEPGASITLADGSPALVVDSTRTGPDRELLAVASIGAAGALPLPYALPADD